ncbi:MAG: hypothetical protein WBD95_13315 [Xanthobacteraceae bacterium]
MMAKSLNVIAGLALLLSVASPVQAQQPPPTGTRPSATPPGGTPRIEVNPRRLLYRRCTSWYVIQYRPSGRVLFPEKHCWWVRG